MKSARKDELPRQLVFLERLRLLGYEHRNANARMHHVEHVVSVINIVDVDVVVIRPLRWPEVDELERIAAINDDRLGNVHNAGAVNVEVMLASEALMKLLIRDSLPALRLMPVAVLVAVSVLMHILRTGSGRMCVVVVAVLWAGIVALPLVLPRVFIVLILLHRFVVLLGPVVFGANLIFIFVFVFVVLGLGGVVVGVLCERRNGDRHEQKKQERRNRYENFHLILQKNVHFLAAISDVPPAARDASPAMMRVKGERV
jgi:hypothetical protein